MRYRKQNELKESGIEWIGLVPEKWSIKKLKFVSNTNPSNVNKKTDENEIEVDLCNYTDVYYNEFITNDIEFMKATATNSQIEKFKLELDDIIITKDSEIADDIAVPALVKEIKDNLVCGYHLSLIKCKGREILGGYLFRLLQSKKYREEFGLRANGITRYGLSTYDVRSIDISLPPLPEQRAIAAFLDRKTAAIDQLIEKKEQLIARLKEKRQALITKAVTKGLDPDAPMKSSGIEWIGEIPSYWKRSRLRYYTKCLDSKRIPLNSEERSQIKGNIPYWGANGIVDYINDYLFDNELILLGEDGAPFFEKFKDVAFKVIGKVWVNNHVHVLLPNKNIDTDYLKSYLNVVNYKDYIWGSTRDKLNQSVMGGIPVILPPLPEQRAIATFLDRKTAVIDHTIIQIENSIQHLKEYRQALISATVTGKIDVRDEVPVEEVSA